MVKSVPLKRILEFAISVAAAVVVFFALGISASAETYNPIRYDVPRISQRPGTGDCAIASMATVEAYCHGLPAGDYNSTAYQAVYSTNGYSISATWSKLGFTPIDSFSMQTLYDQLKTGYPVIVHRTSSHYSVVYGYDGSSSYLEMSGFMVVDVDDSYNSTTAYKRLDKWKGGYSLDRIVVRTDGIYIPSNSLKINGNHPAQTVAKGSKFTPYGMVISDNTITNVAVTISTTAGKTVQSFTASPNSCSFAVSAAASEIDVSSLAVGTYVYTVYAKDSSGESKTESFSFGVDKTVTPVKPPVEDEPSAPVITEVSYKVVIKADPSLNMRKSADVTSQKIFTIPNGEIVAISAECNGWGLASYNGYKGWVSLSYTEKYNEPAPKPVVDEPVVPVVPTLGYARVTTATSIKSTKFIFASNVISVPRNAVISVISSESSWLKVIYNGKEGYISTSLCVTGLFDVDANGEINSSDALAVLEAATGKKKLSEYQTEVADANGDGAVNSSDALLILGVATGQKKY